MSGSPASRTSSVSYTHLDVYKRQRQGRVGRLALRQQGVRAKRHRVEIQPRAARAVPVSYTHLDVYKRQSPSFLFAALLWQQVDVRWKQLRAQGEHTIPALSQAADSVLDEQTEKLSLIHI